MMTFGILWDIEEIKPVVLAIAKMLKTENEMGSSFDGISEAMKCMATKQELDLFVSLMTDTEFVELLKN